METSCLLVASEHEALPIAPLILTFSFLLLHKHLHFARFAGWHHWRLCSCRASTHLTGSVAMMLGRTGVEE